jgi:hypothetical protein
VHQSASTRSRWLTHNRYKERPSSNCGGSSDMPGSSIHGTMKFILKEHREATAVIS